MVLAPSVLLCYVPSLFNIVQNRTMCQDSVFLNCGFSGNEVNTVSRQVFDGQDAPERPTPFAWRKQVAGASALTVDWIRAGLKRTGKTRSGLAKALGRSPSAVTDLLNGHRRLRADEIATVSDYLGIEPPRLIGGGPPRPPSAPLIGYVGAGAVAHFYADGQGPFDDVDAPLEFEADDGGGAGPRPLARRVVRQLARLLRRYPQSAGRQSDRPDVRLRPQRRAGPDQVIEA